MDSSGSLQSSSGDEEEYDSRVDSLSALFTTTTTTNPLNHIGSTSNLSPQLQTHRSLMFDNPLSNYLDDPFSSSSRLPQPVPLMNIDMIWSKNAVPEPNSTDLGVSNPPITQQFFTNQTQTTIKPSTTFPSQSGIRPTASSSSNQINDRGTATTSTTPRNPRKRSRASRRAPTTVLTTDTTNFRAMVQEFTGIPTPPFTSPFQRTRLDLFGNSSSINVGSSSSLRSNLHDPLNLLRPFSQKFQSLTPLNSTINCQLPSNLDLLKQNQVINFPSLQTPSLKLPDINLGTTTNWGNEEVLRSVNGGYSDHHSQRIPGADDNNNTRSNEFLGNSNSSIDGDKGKDQMNVVSARSEGIVESWINCSSDL